MSTNADQAAFPQPAINNEGRIDYPWEMGYGGMTLRQYYAGQAMQGLMARSSVDFDRDPESLKIRARTCWAMVDALLAAENAKPDGK